MKLAQVVPDLRVGLVGCGRWGRHILRDLVSLGARVTVVLPSDRHRSVAIEGGAEAVVGTVDELPEVAGVVVATPTTTHATVIRSLLPRDVPIFVEKPMTDNAEVAQALATAGNGRLFVMHKWRYHPGIEALAAIAARGELGETVGLRCTRIGWGNPHADVDGVWLLAPHDLSIALEVLGHIPTPQCALAEQVGGSVTGVVALLGARPWLAMEVSTASGVERREIRLIGSQGIATLTDAYSDRIVVTRAKDRAGSTRHDEVRIVSTELPLLRELRAFLLHLQGGPPPRSNAADGAAEVRAVADIRRLAGLPEASVIT
jgi:predicted dehydrogenase